MKSNRPPGSQRMREGEEERDNREERVVRKDGLIRDRKRERS